MLFEEFLRWLEGIAALFALDNVLPYFVLPEENEEAVKAGEDENAVPFIVLNDLSNISYNSTSCLDNIHKYDLLYLIKNKLENTAYANNFALNKLLGDNYTDISSVQSKYFADSVSGAGCEYDNQAVYNMPNFTYYSEAYGLAAVTENAGKYLCGGDVIDGDIYSAADDMIGGYIYNAVGDITNGYVYNTADKMNYYTESDVISSDENFSLKEGYKWDLFNNLGFYNDYIKSEAEQNNAADNNSELPECAVNVTDILGCIDKTREEISNWDLYQNTADISPINWTDKFSQAVLGDEYTSSYQYNTREYMQNNTKKVNNLQSVTETGHSSSLAQSLFYGSNEGRSNININVELKTYPQIKNDMDVRHFTRVLVNELENELESSFDGFAEGLHY